MIVSDGSCFAPPVERRARPCRPARNPVRPTGDMILWAASRGHVAGPNWLSIVTRKCELHLQIKLRSFTLRVRIIAPRQQHGASTMMKTALLTGIALGLTLSTALADCAGMQTYDKVQSPAAAQTASAPTQSPLPSEPVKLDVASASTAAPVATPKVN